MAEKAPINKIKEKIMSSCLTLKYPDVIYMCGDSVVSKINTNTGKMTRATGEDSTKIFQFGNYVVFASGIKQIIDPLLIELQKSKENLSFQLISEKAREAVNKFLEINKTFALELVVSTNYNGKLTSCVISSMHDCQVEYKDENKTLIMFNGSKCEKLKEKYLKYCDIASGIRDLYINVYREMEKEVEEIGGVLTVYKLDKNKINRLFSESITPEKNQNFLLHQSEDGSYVEFVPESTGLHWHRVLGDQGRDYHYLSYVGQASCIIGGYVLIQLPDEFKGKNFTAMVAPSVAFTTSSNYPIVDIEAYANKDEYDTANGTFKLRSNLETTSGVNGTLLAAYLATA